MDMLLDVDSEPPKHSGRGKGYKYGARVWGDNSDYAQVHTYIFFSTSHVFFLKDLNIKFIFRL